MHVLIFGATGTIGSHIVIQALEKGYSVKAFTRNADKLQHIKNAQLEISRGDVHLHSDVEEAMAGVDAVICVLGDGAKGKVREEGTLNIIKALKKSEVKRLICQTTLGLGDSWNNLNFFWKHFMFGLLLKKAYQDHQNQEKHVLASGLDYTIVRPSAFTNNPPTRNFQIDFDAIAKNLTLKISKADLASFIVEQVTSREFVKKKVCVSN